jgi:hypothetical protein
MFVNAVQLAALLNVIEDFALTNPLISNLLQAPSPAVATPGEKILS